MSATPCKVFVGFIGFILSVCLYSGVGTAEQIVETESHVVLEAGNRGILPCLIQRKAHLVQWKRQLASEHLLIYLDPYSNIRRRGGPGYAEGLFNITGNYSLVLKDVKVRDEGLYICEVSDIQTGKVFRNRTRVFVRGTGASVVLEMGVQGILPCRMEGEAYEVKWKRQLSSGTEFLVSLDPFFNVGARDGPGYEAGLFNITDDYSLIIKEVKVEDEGLYMCTLFDFKTGIGFRNSTRVFVQAFPDEPFPTIQECIGNYVNHVCTVAIRSTSNLTCSVVGYYPDIDLFFLHESEKVKSTEYEEWNNVDGTKSKNTTIQISVSDEPYQCVAAGLRGRLGNRSVSVTVLQARPHARSQRPHAAAIAVPVLIVVGICLCIFCYTGNGRDWCSGPEYILIRRRKTPDGPISKLELWKLTKYAEENGAFDNLRKTLRRLGQVSETDSLRLQRDVDFYQSLCEWKRQTLNSKQRKTLYYTCCRTGMSDIVKALQDNIMDFSDDAAQADIDHILWEIGDARKIIALLKALNLDHEAVAYASDGGIREVIDVARDELLEWREREFSMNPLVMLSLELDDLECETKFFQIQPSQKEEIDVNEMKCICLQISKRHYEHLLKAFKDIHGQKVPYQIKKYVDENNASLFNIYQMLHDWIQYEECSSYKKRSKLHEAVEAALQRNYADDKWPPDDELSVIASFLSPELMEQLCSKLEIKSLPEDASEEKRLEVLTEWRDNYASSKDLKEKHTELLNAFKETGQAGMIPRAKGHFVYKAELVDLAFHLFAQDLLPFTEALGISPAKLKSYRPAFHPSHMTVGIIGLVCKLFHKVLDKETEQRCSFGDLLNQIPYPNVSARGMLALEISYGEMCALSSGSGSCQEEPSMSPSRIKDMPRSPGHIHHFERNCYLVNETLSSEATPLIEKERAAAGTYDECVHKQSHYEIYNETTSGLTTVIESIGEIADHNHTSLESLSALKNFKVWRDQPRLTPFNFHLAIAKGFRNMNMDQQASAILQGDYTVCKMPFTFLHDIILRIDPDKLRILGKLVEEAGFSPALVKVLKELQQDTSKLKGAVLENLRIWMEQWIKKMKSEESVLLTAEIAKKHKEFNDKLVDQGFIDLAREIMISEQ